MMCKHLNTFPLSNRPLKSWSLVFKNPNNGDIASTVGKDSGDHAKWKMCFFMAGSIYFEKGKQNRKLFQFF